MSTTYKGSKGVNSPLNYRKRYNDFQEIVISELPPDYPTADTYRVRTDNEVYTCDNEGTPRWLNY